MSQITQQVSLYDWSGKIVSSTQAPITARQASALSSPQGAIITAGSDYASTPNAQIPKVDAYGSQYVVASNPLGTPASVQNLTSASSASTAYGQLALGLNGSQYVAQSMDATSALLTAWNQFPSFTVIAPQVALATNASLLSVFNASTSVLRLVGLYVTNASTGGVLGSGNAFVALELHRTTAMTTAGGTALTPIAHDSSDTLASGITARTLGTGITEQSASPVKRFWVSNGGLVVGGSTAEANAVVLQQQLPYVGRNDVNAKLLTMRPNFGLHLKVMSTVTAGAFDITMVFTQATV